MASLVGVNANKAGMADIDVAKVNAVIQEVSQGSKFYDHKQRRQVRLERQKEELTNKLASLSPSEVKAAECQVDDEMSYQMTLQDARPERTIVHIDMDMFYAAVEMRDHPEWKTKPMAVGSTSMLSTSNYRARKFGVRAGMPGFIGRHLCPDLVIVKPDFKKYRAVSKTVQEVFATYDTNYNQVSLDEAYLDLTDLVVNSSRDVDSIVADLRRKIEEVTDGLTASAGIAPNIMLAKICSDLNKPNGQYRLQRSSVADFLSTLCVSKVSGIGSVTAQLLAHLGISTCGDLWTKRGLIRCIFSAGMASFLTEVACGISSDTLAGRVDRVAKSVSCESTFTPTSSIDQLTSHCQSLAHDVVNQLHDDQRHPRAVTVKIKTSDFDVKSKSCQLKIPAGQTVESLATTVACSSVAMLKQMLATPLELRLIGVRLSGFGERKSAKTIASWFSSSQQELPTFNCPVCMQTFDTFASESSFVTQHVDQCLLDSHGSAQSLAQIECHSGLSEDKDVKSGSPELAYDTGVEGFQHFSTIEVEESRPNVTKSVRRFVDYTDSRSTEDSTTNFLCDHFTEELAHCRMPNLTDREVDFRSPETGCSANCSQIRIEMLQRPRSCQCPICGLSLCVEDGQQPDDVVDKHMDECLSRNYLQNAGSQVTKLARSPIKKRTSIKNYFAPH